MRSLNSNLPLAGVITRGGIISPPLTVEYCPLLVW